MCLVGGMPVLARACATDDSCSCACSAAATFMHPVPVGRRRMRKDACVLGMGWMVMVGFLCGLLELAPESAAFGVMAPSPTWSPGAVKLPAMQTRNSLGRRRRRSLFPSAASVPAVSLRMKGGESGEQAAAIDEDQPALDDAGVSCCPSRSENLPFFSPCEMENKDFPLDYFGESTRGDLLPAEEMIGEGAFLEADELQRVCDELGLDKWGTPKTWGLPAQPQRAVFCSRTVNMRSIRCIGYDMDYTLIHYKVTQWEGRAYMYAKQNLQQVGFPVDDLIFDPELVCRGLIIDKKLGNMIKVDRFGLVKRAMHGTRRLSIRETHDVYGRQLVELRDSRWVFLNTLFSVSEGCLYAQLVQKLDSGNLVIKDSFGRELPRLSYEQLFNAVSKALFKAHVEGRLKTDVMTNPDQYVELDNELPLTLLDQREAGKKLALITNSDWLYTKVMMQFVMDRFLPTGMTWRDLFDVIIVSARKPSFFSQTMPLYEIVTEDGMMREKFRMKEGRVYSGGNAGMVENLFKCESDDVMYVGDHIFTDVNIAKAYMRWRTALIVREVEEEVIAMDRGRQTSQELSDLVKRKEQCANIFNHLRTELHRYRSTQQSSLFNETSERHLYDTMARLLKTMVDYDNQIAPMLYQEGSHFNPYWGYLSRAGFNDKSHFMRQIEKYADVYTSRVSNFLRYTPYMYFRGYTNVLAHNRNLDKYRQEVPKSVLESIDRYPSDPNWAVLSINQSNPSAVAGAPASAMMLDASAVLQTYSGVTDVSAYAKPQPLEISENSDSIDDDEGTGEPCNDERGIGGQDEMALEGVDEAQLTPATEFGHAIEQSGIPSLDRDIAKAVGDGDDWNFDAAPDPVQPR